jgi:hypothetical protein
MKSNVESAEAALAIVNKHYESAHFVGGMGEGTKKVAATIFQCCMLYLKLFRSEDPGVWFATVQNCVHDALSFDVIQESIALVKQERHGVPFGLYTSGILSEPVVVSDLGLSVLQVSLFAGNPMDYVAATGRKAADFGKCCGFIAECAEQGIHVEVGVLKQHAGSARDLAMSLGARDVHVYES